MQSYAIIFTDAAVADLERIREHIGQDNPAAASRIAVQIVATCDRLEYLPERGRLGLVRGTRELTSFWPYVVVYRVDRNNVDILRIWHGAQTR